MIYSNKNITPIIKELSFGKLECIAIGEEGRGRREMLIPCPADFRLEGNIVSKGYSVVPTRTGKPKIIPKVDNRLFVMLSSYCGYTRRGDGTILIQKAEADKFRLLGAANGADGDAGRIGTWDAAMVEVVKFPATIIIHYSGSPYNYGILLINGPDDAVEVDSKEFSHYLDAMDTPEPAGFFIDDTDVAGLVRFCPKSTPEDERRKVFDDTWMNLESLATQPVTE